MTEQTNEYLVVGSVPDLVEAFMKGRDLTPIMELDDTTYIVQGSTEVEKLERLTMVANLYLKEEAAQRADSIPGLKDDKVRLAVKSWAGSLKI